MRIKEGLYLCWVLPASDSSDTSEFPSSNLYLFNAIFIISNPQIKMSRRDKTRELKREMKANRISIHQTKYSPSDPPDFVSHGHREKFAQIYKLGRAIINEDNAAGSGVENASSEPWRLANKKKAHQLMALATQCRVEQQNEYGWRMRVEAKLFERFDIEVAWYNRLLGFRLTPWLTLLAKCAPNGFGDQR
jgi:hypothetical protein